MKAMQRKPTYSSSASIKSNLEKYRTAITKADLEKVMGVEIPPVIDFDAYRPSSGEGKCLAEPKPGRSFSKPESHKKTG
jgi:hypothetical protein